MEYSDRIRAARKHARLTQSELAKAVGITQVSVSDLERGKSVSSSYNASIAEACGVSAIWLEREEGEMTASKPDSGSNVQPAFRPSKKAVTYPVISWIAAGERSQSPEQYVPGSGLTFESDQNAGEYGYWLEVKGGSMTSTTSPSFLPGTYVLVQPEGFDLVSGKYYIAQHRDGETTFKQYVYDAGREYLVPLNSAFETIKMDDDWDVIGRVIDVKITGL